MRNLLLLLLFIHFVSCNNRKLSTLNNHYTKSKQQTFNDSIVDIDGNVYHTVKVGSQIWLVENLNVSRYRNGDSIHCSNLLFDIPDANSSWKNLKIGAYCNISYDLKGKYGRLYNFNAIQDKRNITPKGWHVPSYSEWKTLIDYLGGNQIAGGKLKETGTTHWQSPNKGATNEVGFFAKPNPACVGNGKFVGIEQGIAGWWSSTEDWNANKNTGQAGIFSPCIIYSSEEINWQVVSPMIGQAIRCVKDK